MYSLYKYWYREGLRTYLFNIKQFDALNFIVSLFQASTCFEHMCSSSGGQNCIIQSLVSVHGTATYKYDDTRDCIIQFCPPDNEHMCSKHVEAWNKLIIKFSASGCFILNKYIEMHGQQNIKTSYLCFYVSQLYTSLGFVYIPYRMKCFDVDCNQFYRFTLLKEWKNKQVKN